MKRSEIILLIFAFACSFNFISGCNDAGVVDEFISNPNLRTFDSIWVQEDEGSGSKFSAIDLYNGVNLLTNSPYRDAGLAGGNDTAGLGVNFYLRSGIFDYLLDPGHESRWFRVAENYTAAQFDTMSAVYDNIGSSFDTTDFTQQSTEFWEYFNTPMSLNDPHSVFCFWLKGKTFQNNGKKIFGILQPREASDTRPGQVYGFNMSFRVRININGENDFRKMVKTSN